MNHNWGSIRRVMVYKDSLSSECLMDTLTDAFRGIRLCMVMWGKEMPHSHTHTSEVSQMSHSRTLRWVCPRGAIKLGQILWWVKLERWTLEHGDLSTSHLRYYISLIFHKPRFTKPESWLQYNPVLNKIWFIIQDFFVHLPYVERSPDQVRIYDEFAAPKLCMVCPHSRREGSCSLWDPRCRTATKGKATLRSQRHSWYEFFIG